MRDFVAAVNAREYDRAREFATEGFVFADTGGGMIEGVEAFIELAPDYYSSAGFPTVIVSDLFQSRDVVLARGHLTGGSDSIDAATLWRIQFDDTKISRVDVTRAEGQPTLPSYAAKHR